MKLFGIKLADFNALKPKVSAALKADEQGGEEAGGEETEGGSDSSGAMSTDDMKKSLGL